MPPPFFGREPTLDRVGRGRCASQADVDRRAALRKSTELLCRELAPLRFAAPVTHVYNPLVYARAAHFAYLERYAATSKRVVYLGMNPGPFGMAQTGVPFGEVSLVRDWLGISASVDKPAHEHPKRPVLGFECARSEVSGARLWGALKERYGEPDAFFAHAYVANYCPLVFMEDSGRNRTPDKLLPKERALLYAACDQHLCTLIDLLEPKYVIGVGKFAEDRARAALAGKPVEIGAIPHPSPANPAANRGWIKQVDAALDGLGLTL
jgi:single-strand selective monofunctional uracil DNA glycosylase